MNWDSMWSKTKSTFMTSTQQFLSGWDSITGNSRIGFRVVISASPTLKEKLSPNFWPDSTHPHGHDDIEKRTVDLHHTGAQFVGQFEKNLVIINCLERIHQIPRIEGDGEFFSLVVDGHTLSRLAYLRSVGGYGQVVFAERQLNRVGFLTRHYLGATQRLQKLLPH